MFKLDTNSLNCILFGFIIGVIIVLFVRMMNTEKKENMYFGERDLSERYRFDKQNYYMPKCNKEESLANDTKSTITDDTASKSNKKKEDIEGEEIVLMPVETEKKPKLITATQHCDLNEMEDMNHRLVRDVVVGRKFQQGEKQQEFSNEEIDNYFLQHQDFNDKINYSSQNRCDMVEKLAQDRTHNTELVNKQGVTISEVFDGLTKDQLEKMKQCKHPNCVQPSHYDTLTQRQYYFDREGTNGATYSNYNTRYETDNVNNGGKYYDDIEAHDEQLSHSMAYKL
jgi:hypothetical protein